MCVSSLCSPGRCSLLLVYVFVCVMSVLLLHVLLRCFLEPSHTCFLTSIVCSESDRLLDTHRDRIYQGSSLAGRLSSSKQFSYSSALHRGRCSTRLSAPIGSLFTRLTSFGEPLILKNGSTRVFWMSYCNEAGVRRN